MDDPTPAPAAATTRRWRHLALLLVVAGSLLWMLGLAPIAQDVGYHAFADTRTVLGVRNGLDVLSNLPFLVAGALGLAHCLRHDPGPARSAWLVLFGGVALVSAGSVVYHLDPGNGTLVLDRLPMTVGFMGLFVALLGEHLGAKLVPVLLAPAVALGLGTVLYWHWTDDLRPYLWVQLVPLLTIPAVMVLFAGRYTHRWLLLVALACYVLAKLTEAFDAAIFARTTGLVSGHTLKHLLAAAACYTLVEMLRRRRLRV